MDYQQHYNRLISRAKNRIINGYTESHHIIPRCMGGDNSNGNLVSLTAREHYIAHLLLVKIYPAHDGLVWAAIQMTRHNTDHRTNNRLYEWLRIRHSNNMKKRTGKLNGSYGRYWYYCPISLDCGKYLPDEIPNGWLRGKKPKPILKKKHRLGSNWCYNPETYRSIQLYAGQDVPDGWKIGKANKKLRWYYHPTTFQRIQWYPDEVEDGWVLGIPQTLSTIICKECKGVHRCKNARTKYCNYCRNDIYGSEITKLKDEIIRDYQECGSINRALKQNGFPGAIGGYYTQAKKIIDEHYNANLIK